MTESRKYRATSLCIIWKGDSILLEEFPEENGIITYRPVGGTIEYGEDSKSAVIREVKEEINLDINEVKLLGIIELIFPYYGDVGHEFDFIYEGKLVDKTAYDQATIRGFEGEQTFTATWKKISEFKDNESLMLVPQGLYEMLANQENSNSVVVNQIKHVNTKDFLEFS
ncbi:ADP-ribose pyrophosphatase YjhB, NUDIX family [Paenibacillaceae bacterium GAS479]|nr:ADP-ribose pyrophosphatase YjhB, NUDIX family [Paenibacillaceae bacterium GAS479]